TPLKWWEGTSQGHQHTLLGRARYSKRFLNFVDNWIGGRLHSRPLSKLVKGPIQGTKPAQEQGVVSLTLGQVFMCLASFILHQLLKSGSFTGTVFSYQIAQGRQVFNSGRNRPLIQSSSLTP